MKKQYQCYIKFIENYFNILNYFFKKIYFEGIEGTPLNKDLLILNTKRIKKIKKNNEPSKLEKIFKGINVPIVIPNLKNNVIYNVSPNSKVISNELLNLENIKVNTQNSFYISP